jgi:hypothetical protein
MSDINYLHNFALILLIFVFTFCSNRSEDINRNDPILFVKIEGQFVDGMLQENDNSTKGPGRSSLVKSWLFTGKCFWGP